MYRKGSSAPVIFRGWSCSLHEGTWDDEMKDVMNLQFLGMWLLGSQLKLFSTWKGKPLQDAFWSTGIRIFDGRSCQQNAGLRFDDKLEWKNSTFFHQKKHQVSGDPPRYGWFGWTFLKSTLLVENITIHHHGAHWLGWSWTQLSAGATLGVEATQITQLERCKLLQEFFDFLIRLAEDVTNSLFEESLLTLLLCSCCLTATCPMCRMLEHCPRWNAAA